MEKVTKKVGEKIFAVFFAILLLGVLLVACGGPSSLVREECSPIIIGPTLISEHSPFYHPPVTDCSGDIVFEFNNENSTFCNNSNTSNYCWIKKRGSRPAEFFPENVEIKNGVLKLRGSIKEVADEYKGYGGQILLCKRVFSPEESYTFSIIMKPTFERGIISAFFVYYNTDLCNEDLPCNKDLLCNNNHENTNQHICDNNHEIDIEILKLKEKDGEEELYAYFTTWTRYIDKQDARKESSYIILDDKFTKEFHKYSFRWLPDRVEFYIDDQLIITHKTIVPYHSAELFISTYGHPEWTGVNSEVEGITEVEKVCISRLQPAPQFTKTFIKAFKIKDITK